MITIESKYLNELNSPEFKVILRNAIKQTMHPSKSNTAQAIRLINRRATEHLKSIKEMAAINYKVYLENPSSPPKDKFMSSLKGRLSSKNPDEIKELFFELLVFNWLTSNGVSVCQLEPTTPDGSCPDFLCKNKDGVPFYVEAVSIHTSKKTERDRVIKLKSIATGLLKSKGKFTDLQISVSLHTDFSHKSESLSTSESDMILSLTNFIEETDSFYEKSFEYKISNTTYSLKFHNVSDNFIPEFSTSSVNSHVPVINKISRTISKKSIKYHRECESPIPLVIIGNVTTGPGQIKSDTDLFEYGFDALLNTDNDSLFKSASEVIARSLDSVYLVSDSRPWSTSSKIKIVKYSNYRGFTIINNMELIPNITLSIGLRVEPSTYLVKKVTSKYLNDLSVQYDSGRKPSIKDWMPAPYFKILR